MRKKFVALIVALAAVALALTMVTAGQAGKGDIFGSDHDTGSPGNPTCAQCHTPHKAGGMYLWASVPNSGYTGDSEILPLCFSCHDGSVSSGSYIPDASHNHPQGVVMYDPNHDGDMSDAYPITEHAAYETSCKQCMEPDCVKCHDAHSATWVFLDPDRFDAIDTDGDDVPDTDMLNASVCAWCHEGRRHGVRTYVLVEAVGDPETGDQCSNDVDDDGDGVVNDGCPSEYELVPHSTHPEMVTEPEGAADTDLPGDRFWDGDAGDFSGTRLWTDDTVYSARWGADDTAVYVVGTGPGDVRCMTCHTPHGGQDESLTAMAPTDPASSHSPICENCHE